ncbi:hypothetical protein MTO96_001430 [Rhipicephalus appendiculatus]
MDDERERENRGVRPSRASCRPTSRWRRKDRASPCWWARESFSLFRCRRNCCRFDKGAAGLFAPVGDGQKALIPGNIVGRIASILRARPHPRRHRKDSVVVGLLCFYLALAPRHRRRCSLGSPRGLTDKESPD